MLERNENGKLALSTLDLSIFFDDLLEKCQTEEEITWLEDRIGSALESAVQDRTDQM